MVEGLPPHTGLQLRASFLFVDAWRGEPPPYSPLQTRANPHGPFQPCLDPCSPNGPLQLLAAPRSRLTAPSQRLAPTHSHLQPPQSPIYPPLQASTPTPRWTERMCGSTTTTRARAAAAWTCAAVRRPSGGCVSPSRRPCRTTPGVPSRLAPTAPLIFEHLYSLATAHSPAHTFTPPHPPPGSLTPHCIPCSSVNISFGSTLQPAAGGAGCEASWAVDNVEVHTR